MVDEIQTGFGRTGKWFGWQHFLDHDSRPDVVTLAKAMGNGMPIGACWAKKEIAAAFKPGDHGSTYSGQPMASSAALAVLNVMERDQIDVVATRAGARLREALMLVDGVSDVRGFGMLLGVELAGGNAKGVYLRALELGLVCNAVTDTALRLAPPLNISDAHIAEGVVLIAQAIADVNANAGAA
jgi:acetylornithine/N-succinyldiaminopimelate aminotransferase